MLWLCWGLSGPMLFVHPLDHFGSSDGRIGLTRIFLSFRLALSPRRDTTPLGCSSLEPPALEAPPTPLGLLLYPPVPSGFWLRFRPYLEAGAIPLFPSLTVGGAILL